MVWAYDLRAGSFLPEHSSAPPPAIPSDPKDGWALRLLRVGAAMREQVDVAFLALHGGAGEGGVLQALLSSIPVPFTGSSAAASAMSMDKILTKRIMTSLDIPTPPWTALSVPPMVPAAALRDTPVGELPAVVKPVAEGSSVGVGIVLDASDWDAALQAAAQAAGPKGSTVKVLVEKYIGGRELTVGILDARPLPVLEIQPRSGFYDYENKYTAGASEYQVPAEIDPEAARLLQEQAAGLFTALGCRGMARVDYRFSREEVGYCLELNTIPGLTSTSLLPKAARAAGVDFGELLETICRVV
jgi:D-alanine-D-alanine ligase